MHAQRRLASGRVSALHERQLLQRAFCALVVSPEVRAERGREAALADAFLDSHIIYAWFSALSKHLLARKAFHAYATKLRLSAFRRWQYELHAVRQADALSAVHRSRRRLTVVYNTWKTWRTEYLSRVALFTSNVEVVARSRAKMLWPALVLLGDSREKFAQVWLRWKTFQTRRNHFKSSLRLAHTLHNTNVQRSHLRAWRGLHLGLANYLHSESTVDECRNYPQILYQVRQSYKSGVLPDPLTLTHRIMKERKPHMTNVLHTFFVLTNIMQNSVIAVRAVKQQRKEEDGETKTLEQRPVVEEEIQMLQVDRVPATRSVLQHLAEAALCRERDVVRHAKARSVALRAAQERILSCTPLAIQKSLCLHWRANLATEHSFAHRARLSLATTQSYLLEGRLQAELHMIVEDSDDDEDTPPPPPTYLGPGRLGLEYKGKMKAKGEVEEEEVVKVQWYPLDSVVASCEANLLAPKKVPAVAGLGGRGFKEMTLPFRSSFVSFRPPQR